MNTFGSIILSLLALCLGLAVYFAPTIWAYSKYKRNRQGILLLNFFLGWTFLGWVGALIWSVVADSNQY